MVLEPWLSAFVIGSMTVLSGSIAVSLKTLWNSLGVTEFNGQIVICPVGPGKAARKRLLSLRERLANNISGKLLNPIIMQV